MQESKDVKGANCASPKLCRYTHAALVKDWQLAWGALPLISREAQPPATLNFVRVKSPPPFASILAHLQAVSSHPKISAAREKSSTLMVYNDDSPLG